MNVQYRDGTERLLAFATAGLPAHRVAWGAAMRAELATIEDADARRRFARSAAGAAFRLRLGVRVGVGLTTGLAVAGVAFAASRLQLPDGGPGLLGVTAPIPAMLLLLAVVLAAGLSGSLRVATETGLIALASSAVAVFVVLATEGVIWMDRHGVFLLDGDPPRGVVTQLDIALDVFSTGMWIGHLLVWTSALLIGVGIAAVITRPRAGRAIRAA